MEIPNGKNAFYFVAQQKIILRPFIHKEGDTDGGDPNVVVAVNLTHSAIYCHTVYL